MNLFSHANIYYRSWKREGALLKKNIWDDLFSKKSQKKDGQCWFPREWTRVFSKNRLLWISLVA